MIIGLMGFKGVGKSIVARHLSTEHGYVRRPFAYPLKAMIAALGVPPDVLDGNDAAKSRPRDELCGRTARHAMQTLGTEWGRRHMGEDFWVKKWVDGVGAYRFIVADDVRFQNEVDAIKSLGGRVLMIRRDGFEGSDGHASEMPDPTWADVIVWNNGTPADLCCVVDNLLFPARASTVVVDNSAR